MLKKANRIEPGSQQERSLKKHNPWIICTCNRQCYITLITGCYTCEWQIKQEKKSRPGPCCCSWVQRDGKELDHTLSDVGNMGWSLPPWVLIRFSRTGHDRALVLWQKACHNSGAKVNLTEMYACFLPLSLLFFTSPFSYNLFYIIHLFLLLFI